MSMAVRVWVTGRQMPKNLQYNTTKVGWVKTCQFVNKEHPLWEMIVIYEKESNTELKRYYNYDNKKTFPQSIYEI